MFLPFVLISLYPDEWRDFHDCSQDFLQSLSEGDQEAPCHVSTYLLCLNDFCHFQKSAKQVLLYVQATTLYEDDQVTQEVCLKCRLCQFESVSHI